MLWIQFIIKLFDLNHCQIISLFLCSIFGYGCLLYIFIITWRLVIISYGCGLCYMHPCAIECQYLWCCCCSSDGGDPDADAEKSSGKWTCSNATYGVPLPFLSFFYVNNPAFGLVIKLIMRAFVVSFFK